MHSYNKDREIRPYIHAYPFIIDNIDVLIGFETERRQDMDQVFIVFETARDCYV
jgi:hypothetical protein